MCTRFSSEVSRLRQSTVLRLLACRVTEQESISVNIWRIVSGSLMTKLLSISNCPPTSCKQTSIIGVHDSQFLNPARAGLDQTCKHKSDPSQNCSL